jgi:ribosomal protein L7/L12
MSEQSIETPNSATSMSADGVARESKSERIEAYRERMGCGLMEAAAAIDRQEKLEQLATAVTIEDLKPILRYLLDPPRHA